MNRREVLLRSSVAAVGGAAAPIRIDVGQFGASGDGITDDAPAIQAALDHLGEKGGGAALLSCPKVHYRICRGLKLPAYVSLEGPAPVEYPFNAGNKGACALVADFADPLQWMIEPATLLRGREVAYNRLVATALPDGVTYNCGVRNLLLSSEGNLPFGGIRMHGCPGSFVEGVSIDRVGCGFLVNYSFGGTYQLQVRSLYYGVAVWEDANANTFSVYCAHRDPRPRTVPSKYRLPFMSRLGNPFFDSLKLSTSDQDERPYGLLCGSSSSTSNGNAFDVTIENYPGGIFLYQAYATDFRRCYLEAGENGMAYGLTASHARFSVQALHAYLSGTGAIFDFGNEVLGKIFGSGILYAGRFGKPPEDDGSSLLIFEGIDPASQNAPMQRGIRYVTGELAWTALELAPGWRAASPSEIPAVRFDPWSHRIEMRGMMSGVSKGVCFVLPRSCRPAALKRFKVAGGQIDISDDGTARVSPDETVVSLDGIGFARW